MSVPATDHSRTASPSLRQCIAIAAISTAILAFAWVAVFPAYEFHFRNFGGQPLPAAGRALWLKPLLTAGQGLLLAWLWCVRGHPKHRRVWGVAMILFVLGLVGFILAVLAPLISPNEVISG